MKRLRHRSTRIPKTRPLERLSRKDVTRAEYNQIIDILNERNEILNGLRDAIEALRHNGDIQLTRIAQLQAELDGIKGLRRK